VPAQSLEAGDVIRIQHQHDSQCGECLSQWGADAVVTEGPAPAGGGLPSNGPGTPGCLAAPPLSPGSAWSGRMTRPCASGSSRRRARITGGKRGLAGHAGHRFCMLVTQRAPNGPSAW
jgi:hypothetical protein